MKAQLGTIRLHIRLIAFEASLDVTIAGKIARMLHKLLQGTTVRLRIRVVAPHKCLDLTFHGEKARALRNILREAARPGQNAREVLKALHTSSDGNYAERGFEQFLNTHPGSFVTIEWVLPILGIVTDWR